ncbi:hypothetical protein RJ639_017729 [Escallonia herrerae]|uniref:Uncharacterized protein n=1 Tax=Escallonia herrerae TaxID=1293975 RepID=A0AA89AL87_9ASTE|nr:hypothetical protein RJ639_017729 [Escallonia herrerae]
MEFVSDNRGHQDEDDDPPMLSSQSLQALRELLAEQNKAFVRDRAAGDGAAEDEVALLTEDWKLSQFWYDRETAYTVAKEVVALCVSIDCPSVACVACPTLYAYLKVFP